MYRIFALITIVSISTPLVVVAEPVWLEFVPGYPEGQAPLINVLASDEDHAVVEITTPGMWVEDIEESGEIYQFLTLPGCLREEEPPAAE